MTPSEFLIAPIFLISSILTMVGLGEGLIFSLLPVIAGFAKSEDAFALAFLNLIAATSAAYTYSRKKMSVDSYRSLLKWKSRRYRYKNLKGTGKCLRP